MPVREFSPRTQALLAATAILFLMGALVLLASVTAIVAFLSNKDVHPSGYAAVATLIGAVLGVSGTLFVTRYVAKENRNKEAQDVAASLHAEIADRAARCLNDYLVPWKRFELETYSQAKVPPLSWVSKFRPIDPVVYPAVASKMGLLSPDALFCVVQFYFRLNVVQREIDDILIDKNFASETNFAKVRGRLARVTYRFKSVLGPAALAITKLDVADAEKIEKAAVNSYQHIRRSISLRGQLEANRVEGRN